MEKLINKSGKRKGRKTGEHGSRLPAEARQVIEAVAVAVEDRAVEIGLNSRLSARIAGSFWSNIEALADREIILCAEDVRRFAVAAARQRHVCMDVALILGTAAADAMRLLAALPVGTDRLCFRCTAPCAVIRWPSPS